MATWQARQTGGMTERRFTSVEHAQTARAWLQENVVTVSATAGDNGRLFGAVTTATLAEAVKAAGGPAVDKRSIELPQGHIKSTGSFPVVVVLHPDVRAKFALTVAAQ